MASSSKGADEANLQALNRHRTLHLECTEKTFLPGVRIGEGKRCAHRLTQLYFAKTVNKFS
jgi:hypothetical protein